MSHGGAPSGERRVLLPNHGSSFILDETLERQSIESGRGSSYASYAICLGGGSLPMPLMR